MSFLNKDNKQIWHLEPYKKHLWPDYEPTVAVVAASNEMEARELAAKHSSLIWYDKYNSSCQEIEEKSFLEAQFIADSIPCHEDDIEDTQLSLSIATQSLLLMKD